MIRVLIADDSSFMRKSLTHILESDDSIEVLATVADGVEAIKAVKQLQPDVVLLDIEMPEMDGLAALAHIMAECPTPVLMLSALDKRQATIAIKSLEHGAVDFIAKPSGVISYDIDLLAAEIVAKVKMAASVEVNKIVLSLPEQTHKRRGRVPHARKGIVVIGASTGGPRAVAKVLAGLPRDIEAAILVVQHMSPEFVPSFVDRLQWGTSLKIGKARKGEVIVPGRAIVALGGRHTVVSQNGGPRQIRFSRRKPPYGLFPSIDFAMESAASAYGEATLGVLLTGIGNDGAKGLKAIQDAGGATIVEDPSTCVVDGMPRAAIELGCVDEIVPLPNIAAMILRRI